MLPIIVAEMGELSLPGAHRGAEPKESSMTRILNITEVVAATGLSKTTIWRRQRSADFPLAVKLGGQNSRRVGWRHEDIEEWLNSRPRIQN